MLCEDGHTACIGQPAHQLACSIIAALNFVGISTNVGNAFSEALVPRDILQDKMFLNWWVNCLEKEPILLNYTVRLQYNLQGHPEGPGLWHKHINKIPKDDV